MKIGQHVADLLAIVERHAAQQDVRNLGPAELHFERPRLLVGAAEDGEIAGLALAARDARGDFAHHGLGFLDLVLELQNPRRLAAGGRAQHLGVAQPVEGDQPVGPGRRFARVER